MPEGHTLHRLARDLDARFARRPVRTSSPQGRFAAGAALVDGTVLETTEAYGKHLFLGFADQRWVRIHLGLYGTLTQGSQPAPPPRGALRLRLENRDTYADLRGPTACQLQTPAEKASVLARLGPDPLRRDPDPQRAWARIRRSRTPIGALLMDQSVVAGVGNVFRAEVLFRAGLSPYRQGRELEESTWTALWADLVVLMGLALRVGRIVTTRPQDRSRRGGRVRREDAHYVYRRAGAPCRCCGTPVQIALLVGRKLYWCPLCQPG